MHCARTAKRIKLLTATAAAAANVVKRLRGDIVFYAE
jgi:hypothetical protein